MVRKFVNFVTWPYRYIRDEIALRKKIKALRKRDPFIYK
jgi:hypothetical protein